MLSWINVAWAFLPLTVCIVVLYCLKIHLYGQVLWAALRTTVQLSVLSLVLKAVFQWNTILTLFLALSFILVVASWTVVKRVYRQLPDLLLIALVSISISVIAVGAYTLLVVLPKDPWFQVDHAIPLLGIIAGNSLTGITLAIDRFLSLLRDKHLQIEQRLAWGATLWEAFLPLVYTSLRSGTTPILNTMLVAGLVSIPGVMAGQLLTGSAPEQAVIYQIVILFMIFSSTFIAIMIALGFLLRRSIHPVQQSLNHEFIFSGGEHVAN